MYSTFCVFLLSVVCFELLDAVYNGKVYTLFPETQQQKAYLFTLNDNENYDIWMSGIQSKTPFIVMVKPEAQREFIAEVNAKGFNYAVAIEDVAKMFNATSRSFTSRAKTMSWTQFHTLDTINEWLDKIVKENSQIVKKIEGGRSYEGRKMIGVKISFGAGRKAVFIEGGIHAREWISPACVTYIIKEILESQSNFSTIARSFDWYIFPVVNPDGYVYTFKHERFWRKTRTAYSGGCYGADANRNWPIHWGEHNSESRCNSMTYRGPKPLSEKSTSSLSEFIKGIAPRLVAYIAFHSFGQFIMVPYGHTTTPLDNYNDTVAIGKAAIKALARKHGTKYTIGNIAETYAPTTGSTLDWVKSNFNTPLVYVYELRDQGAHGFDLPVNQIIPNNEEVIDSLIGLFREAEKRGFVEFHQTETIPAKVFGPNYKSVLPSRIKKGIRELP